MNIERGIVYTIDYEGLEQRSAIKNLDVDTVNKGIKFVESMGATVSRVYVDGYGDVYDMNYGWDLDFVFGGGE